MGFTIVISRYNEDLEWLKEPRFNNNKVICYNKGTNDEFYKHPNMEIFTLPNVGMCNHTYLYHIIKNYDNLDDLTLFTSGSCMDSHKITVANETIAKMIATNDSVFCILRMKDVKNNLYNFTMGVHRVGSSANNPQNSFYELAPCTIRPFGKFYETYFGNIVTTGVNYFSIFGVSKKHILNTPKKLYEDIIKHVNEHTHTEAAHYLERLSLALFDPIPEKCLLYRKYDNGTWKWVVYSELTNPIVIDDFTRRCIKNNTGDISEYDIDGAYFRNGGNVIDTLKELLNYKEAIT